MGKVYEPWKYRFLLSSWTNSKILFFATLQQNRGLGFLRPVDNFKGRVSTNFCKKLVKGQRIVGKRNGKFALD